MTMRVLTVVLLLCSYAASAEVYRWVDPQGGVHYSDRPESEKAELIGIASRRSDPTVIAQRTEADRERRQQVTTQQQRQQSDQAAANAVQRDVTASRSEQCKKAQDQYRVAIESQRLYRVGKDGEREYLNDAELSEARINAKKAVDDLCKPAA